MSLPAPPIAWIRPLAEPYLRGYRARAERGASLRGWWFLSAKLRGQAGFFVGYCVSASRALPELPGAMPHCVVFAFVKPKTALHRRLVRPPKSLLRWTSEYIRWLTHRPPRFVFSEDRLATLARSQPMGDWPRGKYEHDSRNFFIETLAWLVRSGLVRRLLSQSFAATRRPR